MRHGRIRNALGAAAAAGLMIVPAVPAPAAAAEAAPCQFLMPIEPKDVIGCVCVPVAQLLTKVTGEQWMCA